MDWTDKDSMSYSDSGLLVQREEDGWAVYGAGQSVPTVIGLAGRDEAKLAAEVHCSGGACCAGDPG
ncbi:hypothetical protein [Magnetospira sp. QH-2]|uniref:hypothetical protein n=1 Tax=Magnetospira sp. (strain QH-2) TaxID=1288970 RepID=UPI0005FA6EE7|nr:hypothetical protein [Magnetospira sp. QH-2]